MSAAQKTDPATSAEHVGARLHGPLAADRGKDRNTDHDTRAPLNDVIVHAGNSAALPRACDQASENPITAAEYQPVSSLGRTC